MPNEDQASRIHRFIIGRFLAAAAIAFAAMYWMGGDIVRHLFGLTSFVVEAMDSRVIINLSLISDDPDRRQSSVLMSAFLLKSVRLNKDVSLRQHSRLPSATFPLTHLILPWVLVCAITFAISGRRNHLSTIAQVATAFVLASCVHVFTTAVLLAGQIDILVDRAAMQVGASQDTTPAIWATIVLETGGTWAMCLGAAILSARLTASRRLGLLLSNRREG